ncbi:MAG: DPP IV N-terminal domain-containing protein [Planctomycetota bacterium]
MRLARPMILACWLLVTAPLLAGQPAEDFEGRIAALEDRRESLDRRLVSIDVSTGERETLLDDVLYSFDSFDDQHLTRSPSGKRLALNATVGERSSPNQPLGLYVVDVSSREAKRVWRENHVQCFAFSPDERQITFTSTWELWVHDLDAGESRLLVTDEADRRGWGRGLAWSSDGRHIYATRSGQGGGHVVVDARDGSLEPLPAPSAHRIAAWLPGDVIYFMRKLDGEYYGPQSLIRWKPGGSPKILAEDLSRDLGVAVDVQGSKIAYTQRATGQIVVKHIGGSASKLGKGLWPSFSPGGDALVFESARRISIHDLESGESKDLGEGIRPVWIR